MRNEQDNYMLKSGIKCEYERRSRNRHGRMREKRKKWTDRPKTYLSILRKDILYILLGD